jgi:hypothetical protein
MPRERLLQLSQPLSAHEATLSSCVYNANFEVFAGVHDLIRDVSFIDSHALTQCDLKMGPISFMDFKETRFGSSSVSTAGLFPSRVRLIDAFLGPVTNLATPRTLCAKLEKIYMNSSSTTALRSEANAASFALEAIASLVSTAG